MLKNVPYKYLVATAFVCGLFMDLMDLTIVNVALPRLGVEMHTNSATTLEWVITGYLLSLAIWIPASGWIGDRFGTKKTFLFALAMFTAASALCGLSWSIGALIVFRILQGVGGGMLTPVGTAMLFRAFPPAERARASTILTVPTVIAPALGPILGGFLVDSVTWRAIFWVNLPIGIAGFIFALLFLREHTEPNAGRFDALGFVLSGAGLALILFALSRGPTDGWSSPIVVASGFIGALSFALLVFVELRNPQPMLDLRLFANRLFRTGNLTYFMSMASLLSQFLLLTLYLQQLENKSALEAGLAVLPFSIGTVLSAPVAGSVYKKVGPRRLVALGLFGSAVTAAMFLGVNLQTSIWAICAIMLVRGLAYGLVFVSVQAATYATISSQATGRASSLFNTNRQVASSIGVAVAVTVLVQRTQSLVPAAIRAAEPAARALAAQNAALTSFHYAFATTVVMAALGVVFALMIRDSDAASTMQGEEREPALAH